MPVITANNIEIAYRDQGPSDGPTLIMIQGLSLPLNGWPSDFIDLFVDNGIRVITFDNRDVGKSTILDHLGAANLKYLFFKKKYGFKPKSPYALIDMMHDTIGLMDALDIKAAHIAGLSMGGMISQLLAIHAPTRVLSLTSIMSTTGDKTVGHPKKAVISHILNSPKSSSNEDKLAHSLRTWDLIGSPDYPPTREELISYISSMASRGMPTNGVNRQMQAIMTAGDRTKALNNITAPSLVIHGDGDTLISLDGAESTAEAIPGATLKIYKGMGHDLPKELLSNIHKDITDHMKAATP